MVPEINEDTTQTPSFFTPLSWGREDLVLGDPAVVHAIMDISPANPRSSTEVGNVNLNK